MQRLPPFSAVIVAAFLLLHSPGAVAQTAGGSCSPDGITGAADLNGNILKCVSATWSVVTQAVAAGGSTGYVQFNSSNALAGDSVLVWDNTNKRLGIGTATPVAKLDVNGTGGSNSMVRATYNGNGYGARFWVNTDKSGTLGLSNTAATADAVSINGTGASYFNGGNVGIGTASPATNLEVQNSGTSFAIIRVSNTQGVGNMSEQGGTLLLQQNSLSFSSSTAGRWSNPRPDPVHSRGCTPLAREIF